ncbi:MAG: polysaccharide biosynthesis/export family protein [Acidobacteriaceae bacterium]
MRRPVLVFALMAMVAMILTVQPATAQKESLLIGPGDLIQVDVLDTPEMEQQVRVTDEGNAPLAYVGNVKVGGMTPGAAAEAIQLLLVSKNVMKHPQVTVRVQEYSTQDVSVLGQVHTPGAYPLTTPQPVLRVLSLAGGVTDLADRQVTIKRHGSPKQLTYMLSNDPQKMLTDMVMVYPGDIVMVPNAPVIYIMGDVGRPGGYAMSSNASHLTLLQAIARAGSANKTSVPSKVRLIRETGDGTKETRIHLDAMEKGKIPDINLQANDIIFVPFSWMKNVAMSGSTIAASTAGAAIYAIP